MTENPALVQGQHWELEKMKSIISLIILFLFVPFFVHAEVDEKAFLNEAKIWVDTNIQCEQYLEHYPGVDKLTNFNTPTVNKTPIVPPLGKCKESGSLFCHLNSIDSRDLILRVTGSSNMGLEMMWEDNKYIYFRHENGELLADVFYENSKPHSDASWDLFPELVKFPSGPDLVWIGEGSGYCDPGEAHLFGIVAGKIKCVLNYENIKLCHQEQQGGFESHLIPLKDRNIRLLKMINTVNPLEGWAAPHDISFSEIQYHFDAAKGAYVVVKEEIPLSLGIGALDWWGDTIQTGKDISWDTHLTERFEADKKSLEEIITNLKGANDLRRKTAHELLVLIAGKDIGDNYNLWEKWKNELKVKSKKGDSDQ